MAKEVKTEAKVCVGIEALWEALAKDLRILIPKIIPNSVKSVEVIEGDDVPKMSYQKEKIVELDESVHKFRLQVIEGGHLNFGFSSYKTTFQLTSIHEKETLVSIEITYESEVEDNNAMPSKTTMSTLALVKNLEEYLLNNVAV
ncbi:hypothetical protein DVH24_003565 [Malus domestica]|uniref:Bet v I/Major latex protein domain-containing protein n=1 Tax=Malus domestica TaxID=3750 RepID=A0A498ILV8_MALDO|nr:hypothetical protein DVH24_003565 [Malus domestica]